MSLCFQNIFKIKIYAYLKVDDKANSENVTAREVFLLVIHCVGIRGCY